MIRSQIGADLGSTHVPRCPGEHMVDASANPAIVLRHPKPAPDTRKCVLQTFAPKRLKDPALDGRVEIAGNDHRCPMFRDAFVDPSSREIGFDVAQMGVLAKLVDVESGEAVETL